MAKWADYLITAITHAEKSDGNKYISHVMLHTDSDAYFEKGIKKTKEEVVSLLKSGKSVCTTRWEYSTRKWTIGAGVTFEKIDGVEYLRTISDNTTINNIENLIPMAAWPL